MSGSGIFPWEKAGVSRSTWYRYLKYFQDEVSERGFEWLINKIIERQALKKSLSEANTHVISGRAALRMSVR